MAAHAARRLGRMNRNLNTILGVELICAAQGIEFRAPLQTSATLQNAIALTRRTIHAVKEDRYMAPDLASATNLIASGALITESDLKGYVCGDPA